MLFGNWLRQSNFERMVALDLSNAARWLLPATPHV
jgi:hypothetical protein